MNGAGGSLILGGNDSYGGGTYVEAGTVVLTQGSALPARSSLTVGGGGTLIFDPSLAGSPAGGAASAVTAGVAAVPEPGSVALLVAAAAGFAAWRLRRRSRPAIVDLGSQRKTAPGSHNNYGRGNGGQRGRAARPIRA